MSAGAVLFTLQETELAIEADELHLAKLTALIARDELAEERAAVNAMKEELARLKVSQRDVLAEIDVINFHIKDIKGKLYGGRITSPRELSGFQREQEMLEKSRAALEEQALQIMTRIELAESACQSAESSFKSSVQIHHQRVREWDAEARALRASLERTRIIRDAYLRAIDPAAAETYRALRKSKGGRAIAKVELGVCRGCGIAVTSLIAHRARSELTRCPGCSRILCVE
jgi:uncharacterized protein